MKQKNAKNPRSLFFHLVFVLLISSLLVHFGVFSFMMAGQRLFHDPVFETNIKKYSLFLAESLGNPPEKKRALLLSESLFLDVAYEGMQESWKTREGLPDLNDLTLQGRTFGKFRGTLFSAVKIPSGRMIFFLRREDRPFYYTRNFLILFLFLTLVSVISWWILRKMLSPVRILEAAMEEIASGNINKRLDLRRPREFKKTAESFNIMAEKIGDMIESRGRMLRDVSHDLRSPLTRIKLGLQFLPENKERQAMEDDIREMENLIEEILEASRITDGKITAVKEKTELNSLLKETAEKIKREFERIEIEIITENGLSYIQTDTAMLKRALLNILENAAKYSKKEKPIRIAVSKKENFMNITIADEGPGIPGNLHEKIFEPFFRADEARTPGIKSYGMGLYVTKKIMERLGGSILARNNEAGGTDFVMTLEVKD